MVPPLMENIRKKQSDMGRDVKSPLDSICKNRVQKNVKEYNVFVIPVINQQSYSIQKYRNPKLWEFELVIVYLRFRITK